jgi:predicted transcriptional regulator
VDKGLLVCLNSVARNSRLYWLTESGHQYRQKLYQDQKISYNKPVLPDIDWLLYGWTCFAHRSSVIKILTYPMQPSEIKRLFRLQGTHIRISANNIRDIVKLFLSKGIVRPVKIQKKSHLRYELTDLGIKLRHFLIKANAVL